MSESLSTINTPSSLLRGGRPPRVDSPSSRKRRAAAAAGGKFSPSGRDSVGSGSIGGISELSSGQLQPSHSFTGRMNLFWEFDDDLDHFAQYIKEEDDEDEEVGQEVRPRPRTVSFDSDEFTDSEPRESRLKRFFRHFGGKRKKSMQNRETNFESPQLQTQRHSYLSQSQPCPAFISPQHGENPSRLGLIHSQSTRSKSRDGPSLIVSSGDRPTILCTTSPTKRCESKSDYRTYNEPRSTLPKIGSFDLDIDTVPASPRMASVSPFTHDEDIDEPAAEDRIVPQYPSWRTSSTATTFIVSHTQANSDIAPKGSEGVEIVDASSATASTGMDFSSINRQSSWNRRLERLDIYHRHYVPNLRERGELKDLEDYLGIFSAQTKHRFSTLWLQLVPPLDAARERTHRLSSSHSHYSTSSLSTLSSVTHQHPGRIGAKNKTSCHSIVLKRGPIQFEDYQDFQCEWILLTHGFVVARPNFQYIPRFQAGDLWTSVVQVQPSNPLSITLSCTSRSTSDHLTLTQLKQQQQYGCYTYEISCATTQEQASWLEALRRVVVRAHDTASTNEKELGGLGWQYRVVYVPFFTEAVTGNPIQKDKIVAGCTGRIELNALDSYNSYAPLHYATRANHVRVMSFLLEAGADVRVGDGYGRTPMYYAELHQLPDATIQLLEAAGAQRTKKPPMLATTAQELWRQRNCRRTLCIVAMILLLLCSAAGALLWTFGILEPIGIGGDTSPAHETATTDTATSQPSDQPTQLPIPPLSSRDIATPQPTTMPYYAKTPIPTSESPTISPTAAAYDSPLFQLLESASFDAGAAMRVSGSPQNRAFFWLLDNANLDSYTNAKKLQRYALATLYYSTNGDNWSDNLWWLSDEDECIWFNKQLSMGYAACEVSTKTLTSLDLSFNNVQGTLPPELGLLSGLLRLDLDGGPAGFLTGSIPSEVGYLTVIEAFSARGNQLTGTIPDDLGNWQMVRGIDLSFNKLTGNVPSTFGSLIWLTELTLEMNDLTGFLPPNVLGKLSNLFKLAVGGNQLSGPIPSEIGLLKKLRYLYLESNLLSSLPTEIGLLENLNLLSIFENDLQGAIPSQLGLLKNLGNLLLRSNAFTSSIPSEMGLIEKLQSNLDLSFNGLSGPIPSELGQLTKLRSLFLQSNYLSGAIPNEVSQLSHLNVFRVESNDIVGIVPTDLCNIFNQTYPNFYADCNGEVKCPCCTYCCTDDAGCSCQHADSERAYLC